MLCAKIREPVGEIRFVAYVEFVSDTQFEGLAGAKLLQSIPDGYVHNFIVLVDAHALCQQDFPVLIVDLYDSPGREFRALAREVQGIENNLSIANMGFEEFADNIDTDGVFRGFTS